MKKLMIAAAIVCAAAFAQAASCYWTCIGVVEGENPVSGTAYFVVGDSTVRNSILALAGKGVDAFNTAMADNYSYSGTAGTFSVKTANAVDDATLGVPDGTSGVNAFLVICDSETVTDTTKFYVTAVQTFNSVTGTNKAQIKWGAQDASEIASNWNAVVGVPEPTSGLLLLLGVAGLALRRRRA